MLFNSYPFLFVFLPVTVIGFFLLGRWNRTAAAIWLCLTSLAFYGWWNWIYVGLLLASVVFNFGIGMRIAATTGARRKAWFVAGVGGDLGVLCYYKYGNFFVTTVAELSGAGWTVAEIVLPLGISFFTFTQIAFLADTYVGKVSEFSPVRYLLFVTYFPHLIAGPVLHHREMMPQFAEPRIYRFDWENFSVGGTIFAVGLFKKVILADGVAQYATPAFAAAQAGEPLTLLEAWGGALAYTLQLYFDFSGYSDMAIGLSRLFGVRLPLNFDSPYKAASIIDFWRRWHMTLSRFLRDYLYFALGGNRRGPVRRYVNLFLTMVLGGLWHGAGWTFVLWGALHGAYLVVNHAWRWVMERAGVIGRGGALVHVGAVAVTFLAVVVGWVLFRAPDLATAGRIYAGMLGLNGCVVPAGWLEWAAPVQTAVEALAIRFGDSGAFAGSAQILTTVALLMIVFFLPNTQQWLADFNPALEPASPSSWPGRWRWRPAAVPGLLAAAAVSVSLLNMTRVSEFLYYQF